MAAASDDMDFIYWGPDSVLNEILEFCKCILMNRAGTDVNTKINEAELRAALITINPIYVTSDDAKWPFEIAKAIKDMCNTLLDMEEDDDYKEYVQYMDITNIINPLVKQYKELMEIYVNNLKAQVLANNGPTADIGRLDTWGLTIKENYKRLQEYTMKPPSEEFAPRYAQYKREAAIERYARAVIAQNNLVECREQLRLVMGYPLWTFFTQEVEKEIPKDQRQALRLWSWLIDDLCWNISPDASSAAIDEQYSPAPAVLGTSQASLQICWNCLKTFAWDDHFIYGKETTYEWQNALSEFGLAEPLNKLRDTIDRESCPEKKHRPWWGLHLISTRAYGMFGMSERDLKYWIESAQAKLPKNPRYASDIQQNIAKWDYTANVPVIDFHTECGRPISAGLRKLREAIVAASVPIPDNVNIIRVNRYTNPDYSPDKLGLRSTTFRAHLDQYDQMPVPRQALKLRPGTRVVPCMLVAGDLEERELELLVVDGVTDNNNVYSTMQRPDLSTLKLKF
jgi:hypothetical protein